MRSDRFRRLKRDGWIFSVAKLGQIVELYKQVQIPEKQIAEMREMIAQFAGSRNEVFAEAGGKLSEVFERLVQDISTPVEKGSAQAEKLLVDAQKEKEKCLKRFGRYTMTLRY